MEQQLRRVTAFVNETVWAIRPTKFNAIMELLRMRAAGIELTKEEVQARIGAIDQPTAQTRGTVAVLPLYGVIAPKMNMMTAISGGTSLEAFMAKFRQYRDDQSISAIVCDIDSPGGSVYMLPECWGEIYESRDVKPMVAAVNPTCGSAALYLASAFKEIACTPSGEIGSLGCFCVHEDWSKANSMMGIAPSYIFYGDHKVEGNPDEPLADDARAYLQGQVNTFGIEFEKAVAKGRGVSLSHVRENFGQGRMLLSKDAKAVGLIDRIASLDEVISKFVGRRGRSMAADAEATPEIVMGEESIERVAEGTGVAMEPVAEEVEPAMVLAEPAYPSEREATARELELLEKM
jgi:signal peptide peptidase SppA